MILTVWERLIVGMFLPAKEDLTNLRIIRQVREDLSFSEEEHKVLKFENDSEGTKWDLAGSQVTMKDFSFGEKATEIIKDSMEKAFKELGEKKELTIEHLNLYDKFFVQSAN